MEYWTYLLSVVIIGALILGIVSVKLLSVCCNRIRQQLHSVPWLVEVIPGDDPSQVHIESSRSRSSLAHYEEMPQPIYSVMPGSMSALPPFVCPPPYHIAMATSYNDKPPSYDDISYLVERPYPHI